MSESIALVCDEDGCTSERTVYVTGHGDRRDAHSAALAVGWLRSELGGGSTHPSTWVVKTITLCPKHTPGGWA